MRKRAVSNKGNDRERPHAAQYAKEKNQVAEKRGKKDARRIVIESSELNEENGELQFVIPLFVKRGNKPSEDSRIQAYLDGAPQGTPQTTGSDGRTLFVFKKP